MKKKISSILEKWWLNVCFSFIILVSVLLFVFTESSFLLSISYSLLLITLIVLLLSIIYNFIKRKWQVAIFSFLLFVATSIIIYVFTVFLFLYIYTTPDNFADDIKIPSNLKYDKPLEENYFIDSLKNLAQNDFEVYKSFQPGLYNYAVNSKLYNSGIFYIKAFEVSKNIELSKDKLLETSIIAIDTNTAEPYHLNKEFVIYEGDWGKPYIARFEVWYKDDKCKKDSIIMSKNYIIEGWQR